MIAALCGGVGGSKLALGLYLSLAPDELTVVVNTADDLEFAGLHVSPDVDTVSYTLAGLSRPDVGWGIEGDTFAALEMLGRYGFPTWFQVGDRDLATDIVRTQLLRAGHSLTSATAIMTEALGIHARVLPMTDGRVETQLLVAGHWLRFQDYFVRRRHQDRVDAFRYVGIEEVSATAAVQDALSQAEVIIIVNSNPVLSIVPILAVPGISDAISARSGPCVAVSPIVGGQAVSGPAAELMRLVEQPASALGVAGAYLGSIDGIVIDRADSHLESDVRGLGVAAMSTDTTMRTEDDRRRLAGQAVDFARSLA